MKLGFIGLGKLGMPCAEVMAQKYTVYGYDIMPKKSENIFICTKLDELCFNSSVIFIALPTPHEEGYDGSTPSDTLPPKDFDYTALKDCLNTINPLCDENKIIVIISTVLPGTMRRELCPLIQRSPIVYNPYLIAMGTVKWDMIHPEMIIIGTEHADEKLSQRIIDIYQPLIAENTRFVKGTWEETESIKIFYNTFISAKLSLVNMIQDVAERLGNVNVDIVCDALKYSTHRITGPAYMKAGLGDGGPCHPRDNIALRYLADRLNLGYDLFGAIMESREKQAKNLADKLCSYGSPVVILGSSYKPGVTYTDGSFSLLVGYYVVKNGYEVFFDNHPHKNTIYIYI